MNPQTHKQKQLTHMMSLGKKIIDTRAQQSEEVAKEILSKHHHSAQSLPQLQSLTESHISEISQINESKKQGVIDNDTMGIENMLQQIDSVDLTLDLTLADQVKPKKPTPFQKQAA